MIIFTIVYIINITLRDLFNLYIKIFENTLRIITSIISIKYDAIVFIDYLLS